MPQDRDGRFSTELFQRYQRSEKALVGTLAEMYVQGVSTRKVKAVTEALCGHSFSASAISSINKSLDEALRAFAERRLSEAYPYLILDARYEKVREARVIVSQAVLIAVAVDGEGRRQVLGVDLANRESRTSWRDFLRGLKERGLFGVEFVVSDDHEGLRQAIREMLPGAHWQRCYVHFLRNALDFHVERRRIGRWTGVSAVLHRLNAQRRDGEGHTGSADPGTDAVTVRFRDRRCGIRVTAIGIVVCRTHKRLRGHEQACRGSPSSPA